MRAVVEIKGGFGNQIFQLAFANHLKQARYKVSLNIQKYEIEESPINYKFFGFDTSKTYLHNISKFLYKIQESNRFNLISKIFINRIFKKYYKLSQLDKLQKKFINHFDGYWQDVKILESQKTYILESLGKIENITPTLKSIPKTGCTLVHVRRGDYLAMGENLGINYYEKALKLAKGNIDNFHYEIFTDDIEWVKSQKIFNEAKEIHGPSNNLKQLHKEISKMLNFENYITANSSLSLALATLSEKQSSLIIVPTPWTRNSEFNPANLKTSWLRVESD